MQQDLKKMAISLPSGLMADANAAPYCDAFRAPFGPSQQLRWQCERSDSMVGSVMITVSGCQIWSEDFGGWHWGSDLGYGNPPGSLIHHPGVVYNERPQPGEQGRLVIFWIGLPEDPGRYENIAPKTDVVITVREGDLGIDAVADMIPDYIQFTDGGSTTGAQISDMVMTLNGETGTEKGHPLVANPSFCAPQTIDVLFQGYEFNSVDGIFQGDDAIPGHGDGK